MSEEIRPKLINGTMTCDLDCPQIIGPSPCCKLFTVSKGGGTTCMAVTPGFSGCVPWYLAELERLRSPHREVRRVMNKKPEVVPCARCPSHFFDPDPKAKAPCAVKIQELKAELERRKSFREKWVVKAIKDGGNDIELVECCNCARVEATLEALRNLEYTTIENEEGESVNVVSQLQINTALNREMSDKPLVFHKHHDDDPMFGFDEEEEIDG